MNPATPDQRHDARRTAVAIVRARLDGDSEAESLLLYDPDPNHAARIVDELVHLAVGAVAALGGGDKERARQLLDSLALRAAGDDEA